MWLVNLLTELGILILSGYLAFTGAVASFLESVLTSEPTTYERTEVVREEIARIDETKKYTGGIARVLLEDSVFQRAAVIASQNNETEQPALPDTPLETLVRDALVNVYCQYKTPEYIRTTTGSGFFVHQKGVVITNAHVAQFLLLEDSQNRDTDVECVIRTGDPATPLYKARLLYISPTWIVENARLITEEAPRGTGERDYALLYIAETLDASPLPTSFPSLPVNTSLLSRGVVGAPVVTAGYPAEELLRNGADARLPLVYASSTVGVLYTFGSNYADIFSITASPVGEHGASGGPIVVASTKNAIGIIVTKGDEELEGPRSLRALTLSYIDRTILEETGFSLFDNMRGDVAYRGNIFRNVMTPFLAGILEEEISEE